MKHHDNIKSSVRNYITIIHQHLPTTSTYIYTHKTHLIIICILTITSLLHTLTSRRLHRNLILNIHGQKFTQICNIIITSTIGRSTRVRGAELKVSEALLVHKSIELSVVIIILIIVAIVIASSARVEFDRVACQPSAPLEVVIIVVAERSGLFEEGTTKTWVGWDGGIVKRGCGGNEEGEM